MRDANEIFRFERSRAQRARLFINMALASLGYIGAGLLYESIKQTTLPEPFRSIALYAFSATFLLLLAVVLWHWRHPDRFVAVVTRDTLRIEYPGSAVWSFEVPIQDIRRMEHRNTLSHAGRGIGEHGVLMKNGDFHHISMNYGLNLKHLHRALQSVRPDIEFPNRLNLKVAGFLHRDYRD